MVTPIEQLREMMDVSDYTEFKVPLVYVKNKTILTLNATNRMHYGQRMTIKNKYKKIIEPTLDKIARFDSGHIHLIFQIVFSDRRSRDLDNQIFVTKWVQDTLVELGKLDDDNHISFSFVPAVSEPKNDEHYCLITAIDLNKNNYFKRLEKYE